MAPVATARFWFVAGFVTGWLGFVAGWNGFVTGLPGILSTPIKYTYATGEGSNR